MNKRKLPDSNDAPRLEAPSEVALLPFGYLYKRVAAWDDVPGRPTSRQVYSVSGCISHDFADYVDFWRHNHWWFFDSPQIIWDLIREKSLSCEGSTLFYYEAYPFEYNDCLKEWVELSPRSGLSSLPLDVVVPTHKHLEGYDAVSFQEGNIAECSPLTCNYLANQIPTNRVCLFDTVAEAKAAIEEKFEGAEPGPYRIIAVYSLIDPALAVSK